MTTTKKTPNIQGWQEHAATRTSYVMGESERCQTVLEIVLVASPKVNGTFLEILLLHLSHSSVESYVPTAAC